MAHPPDPWTLKDFLAIAGGAITFGGMFLSGWVYFLQGKIKKIDDFSEDVRDLKAAAMALKGKSISIAAMWTKFDSFVTQYSADRLADAKEFATETQMNMMIERVERKIDDSEGRIEARIGSLEKKIDRLLTLRRGEGGST